MSFQCTLMSDRRGSNNHFLVQNVPSGGMSFLPSLLRLAV